MPHKYADRRKSERSEADICCWTVSLDSFYTGRVANLSEHGLFIHTSKDIPAGSRVCVEFFPTTTDKVITVNSKVIWSQKDKNGDLLGIGVEFISLSKKDKKVIEFYLDIMKKEKDERS